MMLSGVIGIFIGDTALFACFNRIGPRRGGLLFACHAVFSALLGMWLFGEILQGWSYWVVSLSLPGLPSPFLSANAEAMNGNNIGKVTMAHWHLPFCSD